MSSLTTTIEVSRRNRRRLDARRDAVREKTGKARVSLDDVITDLLDSAEGKVAGAPSFTFTPRTGMEPYNHCLNCEWWTGEICECPPGGECHPEEEGGDEE